MHIADKELYLTRMGRFMKVLILDVFIFAGFLLVSCDETKFKSSAEKSADYGVGQQTKGLVSENTETKQGDPEIIQDTNDLELDFCDQREENIKESEFKLYAATMSHTSSQSRDGNAPADITAKIGLTEGNVLQFSEFSGVARARIYHGNIELEIPCSDAAFVLEILDSNNVSISSQHITPKFLPDGKVVVPAGASRAVIGFVDSEYFDNEPKRTASSGLSAGCNFKVQTTELCK